ncbi:MAG: hypothetical protein WC759_05770, partial [Candidatus Micrarchaeia archaeon]
MAFDISAFTQDWLPLGMIALFTSFMLVSIGYILSKGFHLPKLEAWARSEYREVLISALIIAGLVFSIGIIDMVNSQFSPAYSSEPSPVCQAAYAPGTTFYTACTYFEHSSDGMLDLYYTLLIADRYIAKLSSFYYNIAVPLWLATATVSQSPKGGVSILSTMIAVGLDTISTSVFLQMAQKVLLQFFFENSFRWLLPAGIILRTFGLSRKLGGTLIAIAIGTYVVFPLAAVFASHVYASIAINPIIILPTEPPDLQDTMICNPFVNHFMKLGSVAWWFIWFSGPCSAATYGWWACMLAHFPQAQSLYNAANSIFLVANAPV